MGGCYSDFCYYLGRISAPMRLFSRLHWTSSTTCPIGKYFFWQVTCQKKHFAVRHVTQSHSMQALPPGPTNGEVSRSRGTVHSPDCALNLVKMAQI